MGGEECLGFVRISYNFCTYADSGRETVALLRYALFRPRPVNAGMHILNDK